MDEHDNTVLLWAAGAGHPETLQQLEKIQWLLAEGGSSIQECNMRGKTLLLSSAECGHLVTLKWLLAEGGAH